jgi:hypothetical protein
MCNNYYISTVHVFNRGVQIRSEWIHSDFGTKIYISDRIDKVVS